MAMLSPLRDQALRPVLGLAFIAGIGFGLTVPFLALLADDRGVSLRVIGLMAASFLITQLFLLIPMGVLSDRVGRVLPMSAGFFIEALASFGFLFADSAVEFVALRVVQGVSFSLLIPAVRAVIADITPVERLGQAYAWLYAFFTGGILLGPPVGALLVTAIGRNELFVTAMVLDAAMGVLTLLWLRGVPRPRQGAAEAHIPYAELVTRPLIGAFMLGFTTRIIEGLFIGIWSIYLTDLGASNLEIGLSYSTFALSFMLLTPFSARFADREGRWRRLLIGNLALGALIVGYGTFQWIPVILALGLVEGALSTITMPTLDGYLATVADARSQGRAQGVFSSVATVGGALSGFVGALLYGAGQLLPFLVAGATVMLVAVVATRIIRGAELNLSPPASSAPDTAGSLAVAEP